MYTISAAIFFIFCLLNIKSYVFFSICPGLIAYLLVKRNGNHALLKFSAIHFFYFICLYFLSATITNHPIPELLKSKQQEFYALAEREQAKSVIHLPVLKPEFFSILTNTPNAFLITLFRPHLLESHNSMMLLSALENTLITILIFINIYFLFYKKEKRMIISPLLLVSFFFVIITFCLIGLVTPVLGAVVRYKVAALPFLMIILLYQDKWQSVFSIFKLFTAKR